MREDPRLTAYALGELDARERAVVESWLDEDPELALELAAIDDVVELLGEAFVAGPELRPAPRSSASAWWTLAVAAAILVAIGIGVSLPGPASGPALTKTPPTEETGDELMAEHPDPRATPQCASPPDETGLAQEIVDDQAAGVLFDSAEAE
jgi:anti-sigma factor RsiW